MGKTGATTTDLENLIQERLGLGSKKEAKALVKTFVEATTELVCRNGRLQLADFGILSTKHRGSRSGINPRSGEALVIPEMKVLSFKPSASFKQSIND